MGGTTQRVKSNSSRLVAVAMLMLTACTSIETDIVYDDQVDFSQPRSYEWRSPPGGEHTSPLANLRVVAEVDRALTAKGFSLDPRSPSLLVNGYASTWGKIRVADWNPPRTILAYPAKRKDPPRHPDMRGGMSSGKVVQEYWEGILVLEFFDLSTMSGIWRGTARLEYGDSETPERIAELFSDAVRELLKDFPPR